MVDCENSVVEAKQRGVACYRGYDSTARTKEDVVQAVDDGMECLREEEGL